MNLPAAPADPADERPAAAALGYDVVSPTFRSVTPQMIAEAHELGLPVIPWTVNTTADMERLTDLGVDGIITDYPTRLRTLLQERGLKLPKAYEVKGSPANGCSCHGAW
ncbi:glycerophosphodiester phosphodiesterase family protein [Pseudarthrobacter sp. NamB4]|uniref:glycerophosphodiester phosphodiesterase n=1 Tax=Pseudarthrobacter sp. NamB4 TaxID=2576837 RepID=UPI001F105698|nr:glycerophosphodiester phosphodiesterase family protein [Pseudarthrobacter sp. NamB4]